MSSNFSSQSLDRRPGRILSASGDLANKQKDNMVESKNDMVGLNDKFVSLIDKVKNLQDEQRKLEAELEILKEYEVYKGKVDDIVRQEKNELEQKVEELLCDREKLQAELDRNLEDKEYTKSRLKEEQKKKDDVEKDFIVAKRELDNSHLENVQLILDLEDLAGQLEFLRAGFDEEIKELESQIQNKTKTLPSNNKRALDMDSIVESVKVQYANMASRSRDEAERCYQMKMDVMVNRAKQQEEDVRDIKRTIAELVRQIQRLIGDLEGLKRKEESLKTEISNVQKESDVNVEQAHQGISQLEDALRQAKQYLAELVRKHQELMNIKLALDIEIATYRQLLQGEEERLKHVQRPRNADHRLPPKQHLPETQHLPPEPEKPQAPDPNDASPPTLTPPDNCTDTDAREAQPKKRLLIRVQVESGRVVSENSYYSQGEE